MDNYWHPGGGFILNNYSVSRSSEHKLSRCSNPTRFVLCRGFDGSLTTFWGTQPKKTDKFPWWPTRQDRPAVGSIPWIFFNLEAWVINWGWRNHRTPPVFWKLLVLFEPVLINAEADRTSLSQLSPKIWIQLGMLGPHQDLHRSPYRQPRWDQLYGCHQSLGVCQLDRIALLVYCAWSPTIIHHQPNKPRKEQPGVGSVGFLL